MEEERRILWEQVEALTGGKKISFTAHQRRRLAEAGKLLTPEERRTAANQDILDIGARNCNSVEIAKEIGFALTCPESLLERP